MPKLDETGPLLLAVKDEILLLLVLVLLGIVVRVVED